LKLGVDVDVAIKLQLTVEISNLQQFSSSRHNCLARVCCEHYDSSYHDFNAFAVVTIDNSLQRTELTYESESCSAL